MLREMLLKLAETKTNVLGLRPSCLYVLCVCVCVYIYILYYRKTFIIDAFKSQLIDLTALIKNIQNKKWKISHKMA